MLDIRGVLQYNTIAAYYGLMYKVGCSPPNSSETNIKAGARKCTQLSKPAASNTV